MSTNTLVSDFEQLEIDDEKYDITDLPAELITIIAQYCVTHREMDALRCTCSFMYKNMDEYMHTIKLGSFILNTFQRKYYKKVLNSYTKTTHIKMPKSSGKTALGIAIGYNHPGPVIIVVPPSILDHWINEFDKIWPEEKDRDFNLYILHSKHQKSYKKAISLDTLNNKDILLFTCHKSKLWDNGAPVQAFGPMVWPRPTPSLSGQLMELLDRVKNDNIIAIFDEIHMKTMNKRYNLISPNACKTVTLSADNKKALVKRDNGTEKIVVEDKMIEDCIPEYDLTHEMMVRIPANIKTKCRNRGMDLRLASLLYNIYKYVSGKTGKILVFIPSVSIFLNDKPKEKTIKYAEMLAKQYDIKLNEKHENNKLERYGKIKLSDAFSHFSEFVNPDHGISTIMNYDNLKSLNEFESLSGKKCVLFATPRKIQVGINVNKVNHVLFLITPYQWISNTTYSQCVGRFRRVNNTQKSIDIHNIIFPVKHLPISYIKSKGLPHYIYPLEYEWGRGQFNATYGFHNSIRIYRISRDMLDKKIMVYNMKSYAKSLFVPHIMFEECKKKFLTKGTHLEQWSYGTKIDPLEITDEEYIYLSYASRAVQWRRVKAQKWLRTKVPDTKYGVD